MKHTILVIDDESSVRISLKLILRDTYKVLLAEDVSEGLLYCSDHEIRVILLDIKMPGKNGLDAIKEFKAAKPYSEIIMMTAFASVYSIQRALRLGAADYVMKPFDVAELKEVVEKAMKRSDENHAQRHEQYELLEESIYLRNQIKKAERKAYQVLESSITSMLLSINSKDNYTWQHSKRVTEISTLIAQSMGFDEDMINWLRCAALVHDIGKIMIPMNILNSKKLSADDVVSIRRHVEFGAEVLGDIHIFEKIIPFVRHHHERYDGTGYPDRLKGDSIPLESRIIAVADAIDAMIHSPYKKALSPAEVENELKMKKGSQFDPSIVDVVIADNIINNADIISGH